MENPVLVLAVSVVAALMQLTVRLSAPTPEPDPAATVIAMERAALDEWGKGNPDGFLKISDPEVTYFDPFQEKRLNGREALQRLYEQVKGKIHIRHYDMIDPKVQVYGDVAVLTFNFRSEGNEGVMRWNTTEVYRRVKGSWRIIHTHWSLTQPKLAGKQD